MSVDLSKYALPVKVRLRSGKEVTLDAHEPGQDSVFSYMSYDMGLTWRQDGTWAVTANPDRRDIVKVMALPASSISILERLADPHRNHDDDLDEAGELLREACCFLRSHMALCEGTSLARDTADFIKLIEQGEDQ